MKCAVIGAGFWGVWIARTLDSRGHEVLLIDNAEPEGASRNASGHVRPRWYRKASGAAHSWLASLEASGVGLQRLVAEVSGRKRPHEGACETDWWIFDPPKFLSLRPPDLFGTVTKLVQDHRRSWRVELDDGRVRTVEVAVVACGVWTDALLQRSGLPTVDVWGLRGAGVVFSGPQPERLLVYRVSPYHSWTVRPWSYDGGGLRVGDTIEKLPNKDYVTPMLQDLDLYLAGRAEVKRYCGLRPMCAAGPVVKEMAPRCWAATGGGRVGALLSVRAAELLCSQAGL